MGCGGDTIAGQSIRNGVEHMDTATLMWGVLFGSIGFGFFVYGRKQKAVLPFLSGLGLMVFPYVIANTVLLVGTGIVLVALPFVIRR